MIPVGCYPDTVVRCFYRLTIMTSIDTIIYAQWLSRQQVFQQLHGAIPSNHSAVEVAHNFGGSCAHLRAGPKAADQCWWHRLGFAACGSIQSAANGWRECQCAQASPARCVPTRSVLAIGWSHPSGQRLPTACHNSHSRRASVPMISSISTARDFKNFADEAAAKAALGLFAKDRCPHFVIFRHAVGQNAAIAQF